MVNGTVMIIHLKVKKIKKILSRFTLYKIGQYFSKPFRGNVKVELNLSYYPTKEELKGASGWDTSNVPAKSDLPGLDAHLVK